MSLNYAEIYHNTVDPCLLSECCITRRYENQISQKEIKESFLIELPKGCVLKFPHVCGSLVICLIGRPILLALNTGKLYQ